MEKEERWTGGYREGKKNQAATLYIRFLARLFWHKGVFEEAETGRIVSQRLVSSTGERDRVTSSPRLSTTHGGLKNVGDPSSSGLCWASEITSNTKETGKKDGKTERGEGK